MGAGAILECLMMSVKFRGFLAVMIGTLLGLGLSVSHSVLADKDPVESDAGLPWEEARLLAEVLERVKRDYVESVDDEALIEAAIRGMVSGLDPHSSFLKAEEYEDVQVATQGKYSGVGLEVSTENGLVRVISPIDDTPASRAGLRAGDVIVSVDSEAVVAENAQETVGKMRGKAGTTVSLEVLREGEAEPRAFELTRARIEVTSVRSLLLEPDFGYVRISLFSETTSRDLYRALRSLKKKNKAPLNGLILDLRNNPGGVLDAAVEVSDAFLEEGIIVSAAGRVQDAQFELFAQAGDILDGDPIVVLVNGGSASASEIVAGALKDHHRATIMGVQTYGKGSVQTVMPLSGGRAIKLTTSRYFTPTGESIHGLGIEPDVIVDDSDTQTTLFGQELRKVVEDKTVQQALTHLKANQPNTIVKAISR